MKREIIVTEQDPDLIDPPEPAVPPVPPNPPVKKTTNNNAALVVIVLLVIGIVCLMIWLNHKKNQSNG